MEEVVGSNPTRSTKTFQTLTFSPPAKYFLAGVQLGGYISVINATKGQSPDVR
jgi:hypothetical protein